MISFLLILIISIFGYIIYRLSIKLNSKSLFLILIILLPFGKLFYEYKFKNKIDYIDYLIEVFFIYLPTVIATIFLNKDTIFNYIKNVPIDLHNSLKQKLKNTEEELDKLAVVTRRFLNSGKYDRNKVLKAFQVSIEDFFCILKSVENLEYLYEKKKILNYKKKLEKFPLGELLRNIPGAIQPFHNMDVYFIPYTSLGNYGKNYKKYLEKEVIDSLPTKRLEYLEKLRKPLNLTKQELSNLEKTSFALLSFQIDNKNIFFNSENILLSDDIVKLIQKNSGALSEITNEIKDHITSREILHTIQWDSIVDIKNQNYLSYLNKNSSKIAKELEKRGIYTVFEIDTLSVKELQEIFFKCIGRYSEMTKIKCLNLAKETKSCISMTISTLEKAGLTIK